MENRIELASQFLGFSEKRKGDELQKLLRMNPRTQQWCAAFITAIERLAGFKGTGALAARSYLHYGTGVIWPETGDIVILWRTHRDSCDGHVGYLVKKDISTVTLLGGNQDHQVKIKTYPRSRVIAYRRAVEVSEDKSFLTI